MTTFMTATAALEIKSSREEVTYNHVQGFETNMQCTCVPFLGLVIAQATQVTQTHMSTIAQNTLMSL
jgi:hypothetical protein